MRKIEDVRETVDKFLSAQKAVSGFSPWQSDHRAGEEISVTPLFLDGQLVGRIELNAYPNEIQPSFRILIIFLEQCIVRLDFRSADGPHINSFNRPDDLEAGPLYEGHYHMWQDNRRFARANSLPERLFNARPVSNRIRGFDAALRWFCNENNIDIGNAELPALPTRRQLI